MALITRIVKRVIIGRPMSLELAAHTRPCSRSRRPADLRVGRAVQRGLRDAGDPARPAGFGGLAFLFLAPWSAGAVVVLLTAVVASYRQLVRAYPTGGGDYEVASTNLG